MAGKKLRKRSREEIERKRITAGREVKEDNMKYTLLDKETNNANMGECESLTELCTELIKMLKDDMESKSKDIDNL